MADDGAIAHRKGLASRAGVTLAVAQTLSGADLEFRALQREAAGVTAKTGADLTLQANLRANIIATGEVTYAAAGGKVTRIIGEGFLGATAVQFGGTPGTAFSVINDQVIQVTTPAKAAATYDLTVVHPAGNAVLVGGVVYV